MDTKVIPLRGDFGASHFSGGPNVDGPYPIWPGTDSPLPQVARPKHSKVRDFKV